MSQVAPRSAAKRGGDVPYLTIIATIGLVVATYLSWLVLRQTAYILELIAIAALFAVALNPAVDFLEHRCHLRRSLSATVVFVTGAGTFIALVYLFVYPLVDQTLDFIDRFPEMVSDAQEGKGTVGELVQRYDIDTWVAENQDRLRSALTSSTGSVVDIAGKVAATVASLLTVLVLTFLMLLQGPGMMKGPLVFFDDVTQQRIRKVAADCARAVSGYVTGNLLISVIAGIVTFVTMLSTGVPFPFVLAVWVAFTDLIPLVGATLGAIPTIGIAFLHSTKAGVIAFIVYVIYQQIENHIIQPTVMAKTVKMSALTVLVSVLIGVELAGLLGALFAIPVAGVIQVIGRDLLDHRHGRIKHEPTVTEDEIPVSQTEAP